MRMLFGVAAVAVVAAGCGQHKQFDGPTVKAFTGRIEHGGKPIAVADGERVQLELFHEKAQSFKIPIQPDGTFQIGWMPIGKYTATLVRERPGAKGGPSRHSVPGGLTIVDGQTEYVIELGKDFKT